MPEVQITSFDPGKKKLLKNENEGYFEQPKVNTRWSFTNVNLGFDRE